MLYNADNVLITSMYHQDFFDKYKAKMKEIDYDNIVKTLNDKIDGSDIHLSSWLPGKDWRGTVFESILLACNKNPYDAGKFFGLIVLDLMMKRPDEWIITKSRSTKGKVLKRKD